MKKILFFLFCLPFFSFSQQADIVIRNGKLLDGTGNSWRYADVAITSNKIVAIGKLNEWKATKEINANGLYIAPGFIDVHTHIEDDEIKNPLASNFIYDGVTSVVTGNCGLSKTDFGTYFKMFDSLKLSINVAALIGHNDVRKEVMGSTSRKPTEEELQKMESIVDKAMKDGAVGMSTGLIYIPGTYSETSEIVRLAKVVSKYGGVYASHMRNEGDSVIPAIDEALYIGKEANLPVQISHFKLSGQQNWGRSIETIAKIIAARQEGLDVTIDQYPYTASSTSLSTILPDWILENGYDSIRARLNIPELRKKATKDILKNLAKRKLKHFGYAVVANFKADTTLNGNSIEQINLLKGRKHKKEDEVETIFEMMIQGGAGMIFHGMSEDDVKAIMKYPFNMFASDASIRIWKQGNPHPRGYGTNARVLGKYVREEKVISLEEAIRRMTSLPAQKFQLSDRGFIKEGYAADIVIFNADEIKDQSTFNDPHQYSTGIKYVLVNGKIILEDGKQNEVREGKILKLNVSYK